MLGTQSLPNGQVEGLVERAKNAKAEEAFAADDPDKDGWILVSVTISAHPWLKL
jgi:hypothetical protein